MSGRAAEPGAPSTAAMDAALRIEGLISGLLRYGTYLAVALVLVGVAGMLLAGVDPLAHGAAPGFDAGSIPGDLMALRPRGFLWAGLVTVMALPVGRVIVSGLGFLAAGDRRLAMVSGAVLLVVLASIGAALAFGS